MPDALDFEQPLLELENRIAALRAEDDPLRTRDEIARLEERLTPPAPAHLREPDRLAAHPARAPSQAPVHAGLVKLLFEDFVELHGDRLFGDDAAIVGGLARFEGRPVVVIGHQKGRDTEREDRAGTSACRIPRAIARRCG